MSFTCPVCGAISHNPYDELEEYCGACHAFVLPAIANPQDEIARLDWAAEEARAMEKLRRQATKEEQ